MLKVKYLLLFSFLLSSMINYSQFTDVINSNRPGESMGAFSVGKTVFQTELGFYGFKEKYDLQPYDLDNYEAKGIGSDLTLRYGAFFEQLEFVVNMEYQKEWFYGPSPLEDARNSGLKKMILGAKFLLYDPEKNYVKKPNVYSWLANHKFSFRQFIPAVGIYAGLNINTDNNKFSRILIPNDPKISPKFMILTQNQFGRFAFVTNIILDKFPDKKKSIDYVATLTRGISPKWSGFIELQGFNGDYYSDAFFRCGAAYLIEQNIQVDASIGVNYKDTPFILIGGIGLSWRFDELYNDIMLRSPHEKKDQDKKKDKKKDKAKKRLDEVEGDKTK